MTYYDILETSSSAPFREIRSNYRRLVKTYHPDLNPSPLAAEKIVKITEAYEVLSDNYARQKYDAVLQFGFTSAADTPSPQPDKREQYRQDYIRRKRAQEQQSWEQLFHLKVKFYKAQRAACLFFLLVALVYSYDYYFTLGKETFEATGIGLDHVGDCRIELENRAYYTEKQLCDDYTELWGHEAQIHYSRLHGIPVGISMPNESYYTINGTLHSYHNFFSYFIGIISLLLLLYHRYQDWLLTLGLVPIFFVAFLLMTTYSTIMGN